MSKGSFLSTSALMFAVRFIDDSHVPSEARREEFEFECSWMGCWMLLKIIFGHLWGILFVLFCEHCPLSWCVCSLIDSFISLLFNFCNFLKKIYLLCIVFCLHIYLRVRKGHHISYRRLRVALWLLGIELRTSRRESSRCSRPLSHLSSPQFLQFL